MFDQHPPQIMTPSSTDNQPGVLRNLVVNHALQLLALAFVLVWCFKIVQPFLTILVWGSIIAIAFYPLQRGLARRLRNKNGLSATLVTVILLLLIIGPSVWLLLATVDEVKDLRGAYQAGTLSVPPPPESVKDWPLVGGRAYALWNEAYEGLGKLVANHQEEAKKLVLGFLNLLKSSVTGIALFALSIVASGLLMAYATPINNFLRALFGKLSGDMGAVMVESAELTVRNVAKGVLGVAVIQSLLAGFGLVLAGVPFAGLWIVVCLVLAIVQLGLLPVSLGSIIYVWSTGETVTATIFTIWMLFVGVVDNILKPIMLGRGAPAPMLVVFIGSIGGFILTGFSGLFTGAIMLTLGYQLLMHWVNPEALKSTEGKAPAEEQAT
jgi:predicted PurR-regulated permease PerM